jgi:exopolysaccharide biosynthesis polyprenyl glycosylphosphotransferase
MPSIRPGCNAINPSWLIFSEGFRSSRTRRVVKRFVDLLLAFIGSIIFLPLMGIIAVLVKLDSKGPVIFSQERIGQKGKIYSIHKFRSMICDAEKECGPVWAGNDDSRITRVGKIIRKWRFDEIPQLWNVLKGDMSFVGPRPEREYFVEDLQKTIPFYRERLTVKPGLTGWAQVCYSYGSSVEDAIEKLNYDLFYIKNLSFLMDLMIVMRTIKIVLFRKGAR